MKYIITLVLFFSLALSATAQPKIVFKKMAHDYGSVDEDSGLAESIFEFTNTGNEPLILNNVSASCGCTTPEWTRTPIAPNATGSIKVSYNPKNRPGAFSKNVNVYK